MVGRVGSLLPKFPRPLATPDEVQPKGDVDDVVREKSSDEMALAVTGPIPAAEVFFYTGPEMLGIFLTAFRTKIVGHWCSWNYVIDHTELCYELVCTRRRVTF